MSLVEAKPLSGFQDVLPKDALLFERAVERLKEVFRRYGFAPIDTPCIYRYDTLTGGRAGIDKQLFEWHKQSGEGLGEHVALRFDLTVPLARYVAANFSKLTFPFRRYDVGKVWRGERPQRGRFREFYQCDFDLVGTTAPSADLEVALVMSDALESVGAERFVIQLNDRQILNGLLSSLGLLSRAEEILRVVDKLDKLDEQRIFAELANPPDGEAPGLGIGPDAARAILDFIKLSRDPSADIIAELSRRFEGNNEAMAGVSRLRFVYEGAKKIRAPERFAVDLSIARGLGYYTGTVYETRLTDAPEYGSVCSGGRYDDLASYYIKQRLPGVGASVGLSRLLAAMQKLRPDAGAETPCPVLVITAPEVDALAGLMVADTLRRAGLGVEVFPQSAAGLGETSKLAKQFQYGDKKQHTLAVVVAPNELSRDAVVLKDMRAQTQAEVALDSLAQTIKEKLGA